MIKYNKFGWKKDVLDERDFKFDHLKFSILQLPEKIDLSTKLNSVYSQGTLGSCTANAISSAIDYHRKLQNKPFINPSRLFIYYNERAIEGTIKEDAGAFIRDGIKTLSKDGVCDETLWPYDISKFTKKPLSKCYKEAQKIKAVKYERIDNKNLNALKTALSQGFPIIFGFTVFESFESEIVAKTGIVPMPKLNEPNLGGHAVLLIGYDSKTRLFKVRNSWGENWGDKGNFYIPFEFLTNENLASDFWSLSEITK
jgi:C1A family cysteine protease